MNSRYSSFRDFESLRKPVSRLDSVLEFSRQYRATNDNAMPLKLEGYLSEFPHSPSLMLAIGIAFLYHSTYYQPYARETSATCGDTLNFNYSDSALHWIGVANRTDSTIRDYENELPVANWLGQAYTAKIFDALREHRAPQIRKLLIDAKLDRAIAPIQFEIADELLDELPRDAVLLLDDYHDPNGNALLPLWYRQVVDRERVDVSLVCNWLLTDSAYLFVVGHGLEGISKRVDLIPRHSHHIDATENTAEITVDTVFLPGALRTRIQQLTGRTQPRVEVLALNPQDDANILPNLKWDRPIFAFSDKWGYDGALLRHGLAYEFFPVNDTTRSVFVTRFLIDSIIVERLKSRRFAKILRETNRDQFDKMLPDILEEVRHEWPITLDRRLAIFNAIWNVRSSIDSALVRPMLELGWRLIPAHVSPAVSHWADTAIHTRLRSALSRDRFIEEELSLTDFRIEAQLGNCEYLHRLATYAYSLGANHSRFEMLSQLHSLLWNARFARCSWAGPNHYVTLGKEESTYHIGDTVQIFATFSDLPHTLPHQLTVKWFNSTTSEYVRIDSGLAPKPYTYLKTGEKDDGVWVKNEVETADSISFSFPLRPSVPFGSYCVYICLDNQPLEQVRFELKDTTPATDKFPWLHHSSLARDRQLNRDFNRFLLSEPRSLYDTLGKYLAPFGTGSPTAASNLERSVPVYPHSSRLLAAIGHAFLIQSHLYRYTTSEVCADTMNLAYADSALVWLAIAKTAIPSPDGKHTLTGSLSTDILKAFTARVFEALRVGDKEGTLRALREENEQIPFSSTTLALAKYLLNSTPQHALFWIENTWGRDDYVVKLLPAILYLHFVKRYREDISVVIEDGLMDNSYLHTLRTGADLQPPISFDDTTMSRPPDQHLLTSGFSEQSLTLDSSALSYFHSRGFGIGIDTFYTNSTGYSSGLDRKWSILAQIAWKRPSVEAAGSTTISPHSINGLLDELFPSTPYKPEKLSKEEIKQKYRQLIGAKLRVILATLDDPAFQQIFSSEVDSSWVELPTTIQSQWEYTKRINEQTDSAAIVPTLQRLLSYPYAGVRQWKLTTALALNVYSKYHSDDVAQLLHEYLREQTPSDSSQDLLLPYNVLQYADVAKTLGKCDIAISAEQALRRHAARDSVNAEELFEGAYSLHDAEENIGCISKPAKIYMHVSKLLANKVDSLSNPFTSFNDKCVTIQPSDSLQITLMALTSNNNPTFVLKTYDDDSGNLLHTDTLNNLNELLPTPDEKSVSTIHTFMERIPFALPHGIPPGAYRIDCVESGEVRAQDHFFIFDPAQAEFPE